MTAIDEDKRNINDTRIRKLLQKNNFLHDRNNKTFNRTHEEEYEMTMDLHVRRSILTDSTIN